MNLFDKIKIKLTRAFEGPDTTKNLVVSFPKSGRTWLRVMLHNLQIPVKFTHDGSRHLDAVAFSKLATDKSHYKEKKVVLLVRDPRDTVVSGYYQATKRISPPYDGSISEFIRDPRYGIEKIVRFNLNWFANASIPESIHLLEYERLRADTVGEMTRLATFLGKPALSRERIADAVEAARFENMKAMESKGAAKHEIGVALAAGDSGDPNSYKVRKGKIGGYTEELSQTDIAFCDEVLRKYRYEESLRQARHIITSPAPRA